MTVDSSKLPARVMTVLAVLAVTLFPAAMILRHDFPQAGPSMVHLVMAVGIMPLIMGAMIYFTPVLTRSRAAGWPLFLAPLLALVAGVLVSVGLFWRRDLLPIPAVLAMVATGILLGWMSYRARTMLGRPHPGLAWYRWALVCLLLGLTAIFVATLLPEFWATLRRFHLHVNLLGFVGLAALGTLRVLIPTAAGYVDPDAHARLHGDLYLVVTGSLLIATGSAWLTWLVWPGVALWLIPLGRFAMALATSRRKLVWGWHRPAASLGLAVLGLPTVLIASGLHAIDARHVGASLSLFFFIFLFPLVTGAVSYLLPVWLWPGRQGAVYESSARRLAWGSGMRSLVFFAAGVMAWSGMPEAVYLAAAGVLTFLFQVAWVLGSRFSSSI
ncbi:MAG: hypothetical protein HY274_11120 [Gammaproteobacteria bacterium]|nr:hypothetical protein [Gammaproteobacteria bacterium]